MRGKLACTAVLLVLAAQTWAQEDKLEIKPFVKTGTYVVSETQITSSPSTAAVAMPEMRAEQGFELTVSENKEGQQVWHFAYKSAKQTMIVKGRPPQVLDRTPPEGMSMEMVIDPKGQVIGYSPIGKAQPIKATGEASKEQYERFVLKEMSRFMPHLLVQTTQPVAVGDTWEQKPFDYTFKPKCKLLKLTKDTAEIEITSSTTNGGTTAKYTQTAIFDRKLQAVTSSRQELKIEQKAGSNQTRVSEATLKPGKFEAASQPASSPTSKPTEK